MVNDFSLLVSKALSSEADEQEKQWLGEMLRDNETDASLYNAIREYWNADIKVDETLSADIQKRIFEKLKTDRHYPGKRNFVFRFFSAAAVVLLAIVGGLSYYFTINQKHTFTYATQNAIADYVMQDGTKVKLNKNSSVSFTSAYGKKDRKIQLTGEAYFEVQKNENIPFTVHAQSTETQALGTTFNILSDEPQKQVTVALVEGSALFEADKCTVMLLPQEEIVYHTETNKFEKQTTDLQFNIAWKEGRYFYRDIAFSELLNKLEHIYGIPIQMDYPEIASDSITTSLLVDRPLQEILSGLQSELMFDFKKTADGKIIITQRPLD